MVRAAEITDPDILAALGSEEPVMEMQEVSDPDILAELSGEKPSRPGLVKELTALSRLTPPGLALAGPMGFGKTDQDEGTVAESIYRGVNRGTRQTIGSLSGAAGIVGGSLRDPQGMAKSIMQGKGGQWIAENFGKLLETVGQEGKEWAKKAAEPYRMPKEYEGRSLFEEPSLALDPRWLAETTGEALPSVGASVVPGVGAAKGVQIAGKFYKWTPELINRLAKVGLMVGGGVTGGMLEGSGTYEEALEMGMPPEEAREKAYQMAAASTGLNALSLGKMFQGSPAKAAAWRKLVHWFTAGATEAVTEAAEEPAEALILGTDVIEAMKRGVNVMPASWLLGAGGSIAAGGSLDTRPAEEPVQGQPGEETLAAPQQEEVVEAPTMPPPEREADTTVDRTTEPPAPPLVSPEMQAELSREKFTPETKISEEVTLDEAVERVSRGDETVLPDIAEGVKQHGSLAMQDEIINGAITKARKNGTQKAMAKIEPELRKTLKQKTVAEIKAEVGETETIVLKDDIATLIDRYENEADITFFDFVDKMESLAEDSNSPQASEVLSVLEDWREAEREDREEWGMRGDMDAEETKVLASLKKFVKKPAKVKAKKLTDEQIAGVAVRQQEETPKEVVQKATESAPANTAKALKEQKKYLIENIDEAIKNAPEQKGLRQKIDKAQRLKKESTVAYGKAQRAQALKKPFEEDFKRSEELTRQAEEITKDIPSVTIAVPNDGTFTVYNDKATLQKFKEIVSKQFPTTPVKEQGIPKPASTKPSGVRAPSTLAEGLAITMPDGTPAYTNGHILMLGTTKALPTEIAERWQPVESTREKLSKSALDLLSRAQKDAKNKVSQVVFVSRNLEPEELSVSKTPIYGDRHSLAVMIPEKGDEVVTVDVRYYQHAKQQYPQATFKVGDELQAVVVYDKGKAVGLIMPMRSDEEADTLAREFAAKQQAGGIKTETPKRTEKGKKFKEEAAEIAKTIDETIHAKPSGVKLSSFPGGVLQQTEQYAVNDKIVYPGQEKQTIQFDIPEAEARYQASKGAGQRTILRSVKEWWGETRQYFKHEPYLDKEKDAAVINIMREFENTPEFSKHVAAESTTGILAGLGPKKYEVFTKTIILDDMMKDLESGLLKEPEAGSDRTLPFGFKTTEDVQRNLTRMQALVESNPDIKKALEKRKALNESLKRALVEEKLLPEEVLKDERYFHHQVLEYMDARRIGAGSMDVRIHKKGYQRKRKGASLDYNTEYIESEFEWMAHAISQLKTAEIMRMLQPEIDITAALKKQAKEENVEDWQTLIPIGYIAWRPKPDTAWYKAVTVSDRILQQVLAGERELTEGDLRTVMARGRDAEWIIPENVAKVLDGVKKLESGAIDDAARAILTTWKQWKLLNPTSAIKYNLNNMSGDLDIVLAYNPKILKYAPDAIRDAWAYYKGKASTPEVRQAIEYGVINSGLTVQEIPDIGEAGLFKILTAKEGNIAERYWDQVKGLTNFREHIMRLAAFRYFKAELAKGKTLYAASNRDQVNAEKNLDRRAALLARDLIGDYGNISKGGQWLRERMMPFWSWMEINAARYVRIFRNAAYEVGNNRGSVGGRMSLVLSKKLAGKYARHAFTATMLYTLIALWNEEAKRLFDIDDDEVEGLYEERRQYYIILGKRKDGTLITLRFEGALSDALDWFALGNLPETIKNVYQGKKGGKEVLSDALHEPINRVVNASHPFLKTFFEVTTEKTLFPDIWKARPIRDRQEHFWKMLSLDIPYRYIAGKPVRGMGTDIQGLLLYSNDPGERAYWGARRMEYDFLDKEGKERPGFVPNKKSNALYYFKQARRFNDEKAAKKYFMEYIHLGGTKKGLGSSLEKGRPGASIPKPLRGKFKAQLSPQQERSFSQAREWYQKHMALTESDMQMITEALKTIREEP